MKCRVAAQLLWPLAWLVQPIRLAQANVRTVHQHDWRSSMLAALSSQEKSVGQYWYLTNKRRLRMRGTHGHVENNLHKNPSPRDTTHEPSRLQFRPTSGLETRRRAKLQTRW